LAQAILAQAILAQVAILAPVDFPAQYCSAVCRSNEE